MPRHERLTQRLTAAILLGFALPAAALSPHAQKVIQWEGDARPFQAQHFEIPLKAVQGSVALRISPKILRMLIRPKDGEHVVRWPVYPEDQRFGNQLAGWLAAQGLDSTRYTGLIGHPTKSRSVIYEDPTTGDELSGKVGTNFVNGIRESKGEKIVHAKAARYIDDHLARIQQLTPFVHFDYYEEPAFFGIQGTLGGEPLDQAFVVRAIDKTQRGTNAYSLPGSAIFLSHDFFAALGKEADLKWWGAHNPHDVLGADGVLRLFQGHLRRRRTDTSSWPQQPDPAEWNRAYFAALEGSIRQFAGLGPNDFQGLSTIEPGPRGDWWGGRTYSTASLKGHHARIAELAPLLERLPPVSTTDLESLLPRLHQAER